MGRDDVTRRTRSSRREDIVRTAAQTFAERGYLASTTREIAERSSSATIYYHFESKAELVVEVVSGYFDELTERYAEVARSGGDPTDRLRALVATSIAMVAEHPHESLIISRDWPALIEAAPELNDRGEEMRATWIGILDEGIRTGRFRDDLDPGMVYRMSAGSILWVPRWFRPEGPSDVEAVATTLAELLLAGLESGGEAPAGA